MAEFVAGPDCASAWANGVQKIAGSGNDLHQLITVIATPSHESQKWFTDLGPQRIDPQANSLRSVVRMLAPEELLDPNLSRATAYARSWKRIDAARARGIRMSTWRDTYFERLTRLHDGTNQIENIIEKLRSWHIKPVGSFYAHTTFINLDGLKVLGNPCLQYVQFLPLRDSRLDLIALYRNHDFFKKALGNFVGLGRLLGFVARHTNREPGRLTCISAHAYIETKKKQLVELASTVT